MTLDLFSAPPSPRVVALVGCGKTKRSAPAPARDLYTGGLFHASLAAAEREAAHVFIISAAHGLVTLDEVLEPYDLRLSAGDLEWGRAVAAQLRERFTEEQLDEVRVFAGVTYAAPLRVALRCSRWNVTEPLAGLGIGRRLAALKERTATKLTPLMLDLCAGLGGASAEMRARGWRVVRVELDRRFPAEAHADVRAWSWTGPRPDLVWASPPCTEFARESMPWCRTGRAPSLQLVRACLRIIEETRPRFWLLENVRGAPRWLRPLLGPPIIRTGPLRLWGRPPALLAMPKVRAYKERLSGKHPERRSVIPREVSAAVADAVQLALRNEATR